MNKPELEAVTINGIRRYVLKQKHAIQIGGAIVANVPQISNVEKLITPVEPTPADIERKKAKLRMELFKRL